MRKFAKFLLLSLCMMVILAACGEGNNQDDFEEAIKTVGEGTNEEESEDGMTIGEPEVTDVTLRLNWRFKGEFSPFFVAQEKGFFEKYGLHVDVLEGNGSTSTMQAVAQGQDDFGVTSTVEPSQGLIEGMPIKMIASYMNRSPIMIASHPETPVETPQDLEGKSIAMSIASTFTNVYPFFLESNGVDESLVDSVQVESSARNGLFLNKEVDAVAIFSTNEYPLFERELGVELTPLYLADFGYDLAGLTLIGNESFLEENPNTVKRFLAAIDEAFEYTLANKDETVELVMELFPDAMDEETALMQLELLEEIALFDGLPYGWMSEENMEDTLDILEVSDLISERYEVDRYYTNEYFEQ
ncbi:ABC transporter substrate-binding protein [Alkalihalobacillus hemicellulosilyticus]|uniref:Hydroxymethylpyrimidine ABC transporter n=1 Tax=Halalkalibacter hemicellulosilyticusJCM 9152 TaxID=1236971 RepID=W4QEQ2_9BACI|nr:ABC transporter substrate-binding protein [Halalkalibacter hemicellulosilyticus]GAE29829.1 hydroxymethylpyrimidine ABC transporter [Halalkalibacter hemicellulosilyticusJCM 9152]